VTYLDHAATTPMLPEVVEAVTPWLGRPANPSSVHTHGRAAADAVERARAHVASLLGRDPAGIVFTSGATEANHLALRGFASRGARRFAAAPIEHPSVHGALAAAGVEVVELGVGRDGVVRIELPQAVDVIVLQAVNHETGVRQPVAPATEEARRRGALLHVDATQAAGKVRLELGDPDAVVLSAHKIGGPVGVGAVSLTHGIGFPALITGGAQERGRRAGTVNVAGVVGFGEACRVAIATLEDRVARWEQLARQLRAALPPLGGRVVGAPIPSTTCVVFEGVLGELVVQALDLDGISVSSGAACASGSTQPSPVLSAMGEREPRGGVRVSFGAATSPADVDTLLRHLPRVLDRIRASGSWEP
jgi:cysteine desulfurase